MAENGTTIEESQAQKEQPKKEERMLVPVTDDGQFSMLLDSNKFAHLQRLGTMFANSDLVPEQYRGKVANCTIGIAAAIRLEVDPLMFLQKTYIVSGKPGMEAQLAIALVNSRGRLKNGLKYKLEGAGDDRGCVAWGIDAATDERLDGPRVTVAMAKAEGWYERNPKWRNLTDLMLTYRAAAFFARVHRPESLLGFALADELEDVEQAPRDVTPTKEGSSSDGLPPLPKEKEPEAPIEAAETAEKRDLGEPEPDPPADEPKAEQTKEPEVVVTEIERKALWRKYREVYGTDETEMSKYLASIGRGNTKQLTPQEYQNFMIVLGEKGK